MSYLQVQSLLVAAMGAVSENPIIILLMINIILLILGTFMDMAPMVIISHRFSCRSLRPSASIRFTSAW